MNPPLGKDASTTEFWDRVSLSHMSTRATWETETPAADQQRIYLYSVHQSWICPFRGPRDVEVKRGLVGSGPSDWPAGNAADTPVKLQRCEAIVSHISLWTRASAFIVLLCLPGILWL